jgi:hypothetical protein
LDDVLAVAEDFLVEAVGILEHEPLHLLLVLVLQRDALVLQVLVVQVLPVRTQLQDRLLLLPDLVQAFVQPLAQNPQAIVEDLQEQLLVAVELQLAGWVSD